jgi:hypothetical protein
MQQAGVISAYLETLADALGFDRALACSVRQEVEDHLYEAAAADPVGDRHDAERRAVATFGDPHAIARQFAVVSLAKQSRRVAGAVILVIAGTFLTMKARVAWYAATQWAMNEEMKALAGTVGVVDRYSFWLSVMVGIGSWAYISARRFPAGFDPPYRKQLRVFCLLCATATSALVVSVISDGVLTAFQLRGTEWSIGFLIPIVSMAIEIACAGVLVFHIRSIVRRMAFVAALSKT